MLRQVFAGSGLSGVSRWEAGRARPDLGPAHHATKRTFDEDLALFERQVRDEIQDRFRRSEIPTAAHPFSASTRS